MVSHPQDSKGGDLRDSWMIGSMPDYMEVFSPISERKISTSTGLKGEHEEAPSLLLQMIVPGLAFGGLDSHIPQKRQNSQE